MSKYAESGNIGCRSMQKVLISVVEICKKLWYQLSKYTESVAIGCQNM